jgi:AraC family transcriptional regulator
VPPACSTSSGIAARATGWSTPGADDRHPLEGLPAAKTDHHPARRLPARRVAYVRVHQPYQGGVPAASARMVASARQRCLDGGQWLGYQWDDPEIVALDQCRYDVGLEIPPDAPHDPDVNTADFPAMTVAELAIDGPIDLEMRALDWLYRPWLPHSGHVPDHQPVFEAWNGEPFAHGLDRFDLRIQLAVVDAAAPL